MKILEMSLALGLCLAACSGGDDDVNPPDAPVTPMFDAGPDAPPGPQTIRVNDDVTQDTTWEAINTYVLPRLKTVFVQPGATLTIEPGTTILGEQGSVLVVTRGAMINAAGTPAAPITFTSAQPEGSRTPGFWGGLLILGAAPINVNVNSMPPSNEAVFEAFTSAIPEGKFGGDDPSDSSGVLQYVRIQFGGFNFVADREFNNLTLCGVGNGTTIDHLQLHRGKDDGIEFFGGTVNVKYVLSDQNEDDGFDTDNGWQGKGQFIIIQNVQPDASREASNGFESDNHGTAASYTAAPRTMPTMYNVTVLGNETYTVGPSFAAVLRRGTGGHYYNHVFMNFPNGIELRDQATADQVTAGDLFIKSSIFFNNSVTTGGGNWPPAQAMGDIDEMMIFTDATWDNQEVDPGIPAAAFDVNAPVFKLAAGAAALTGGATPPNDGFFDVNATYIGAFDDTTDWTAGWTAYPQN
jgi:hypothetical protein